MTAILTWNIQNGRGCDGVIDLARIARVAQAMGEADVLCFQEIARHDPAFGGGADQVAELEAVVSRVPAIFGPTLVRGERQYGNLHPLPPAGAAGVQPPAAASGRRRHQAHAAPGDRGGGADAGGPLARDDHAPRVLLGRASRRAGRAPARDPGGGGRRTRRARRRPRRAPTTRRRGRRRSCCAATSTSRRTTPSTGPVPAAAGGRLAPRAPGRARSAYHGSLRPRAVAERRPLPRLLRGHARRGAAASPPSTWTRPPTPPTTSPCASCCASRRKPPSGAARSRPARRRG